VVYVVDPGVFICWQNGRNENQHPVVIVGAQTPCHILAFSIVADDKRDKGRGHSPQHINICWIVKIPGSHSDKNGIASGQWYCTRPPLVGRLFCRYNVSGWTVVPLSRESLFAAALI
jgi:hypothetical protein